MGCLRQEYWSGLPFPPPGGIDSQSRNQTLISHISGGFFTTEPPENYMLYILYFFFSVSFMFSILHLSPYFPGCLPGWVLLHSCEDFLDTVVDCVTVCVMCLPFMSFLYLFPLPGRKLGMSCSRISTVTLIQGSRDHHCHCRHLSTATE